MLIAEEDIQLPPPEPDDDYDPKAEINRMLDPETFLEHLGFRFLNEEKAYRRFIIDIPLKRPLTARVDYSNVSYTQLRIWARLWASQDAAVSPHIRFCVRLRRILPDGAGKAYSSLVKHYYIQRDFSAHNAMKSDLVMLRTTGNRARTANGFLRIIRRKLKFHRA